MIYFFLFWYISTAINAWEQLVDLGGNSATYNAITLLNGILTLLATISIPVILGIYSHRQSNRDKQLQKEQVEHDRKLREVLASREQKLMASQWEILLEQKRILQLSRFDSLIDHINNATTKTSILRYWNEALLYEPELREELLTIIRRNPVVALPGTMAKVLQIFQPEKMLIEGDRDFTYEVYEQYFSGFEARYRKSPGSQFEGLVSFLRVALNKGFVPDTLSLSNICYSELMWEQNVDRGFFAELIRLYPPMAPGVFLSLFEVHPNSGADYYNREMIHGAITGLSDIPHSEKSPYNTKGPYVPTIDYRMLFQTVEVSFRNFRLCECGHWGYEGRQTVVSLVSAIAYWITVAPEAGGNRLFLYLTPLLESVDRWEPSEPHYDYLKESFKIFGSTYPSEWKLYESGARNACKDLFSYHPNR